MNHVELERIRNLLNKKLLQYDSSEFIARDPISIPHRYGLKQDIEISGFFAAIFAWGNRTTIINKSSELLQLMDNGPFDFVCNYQAKDLKRFDKFVHRTFNAMDLQYFLHFFQQHYSRYDSLEHAFLQTDSKIMKDRIVAFHNYFFSMDHLSRTRKHISSPAKNSACKRVNMFLRWMVRSQVGGIDFGLWSHIKADELVCPIDIHVSRVAFRLGLIPANQANWKMAEQLTSILALWDSQDPVKYDIALFSMGAEEKFR